ncbi:MAG: PTS sugar transporter subunit IIB [Anaerolineales bacterium]|nr:PTS sugar transporter subunit IIB [Anaerolineales bacterium]MBX3005826.1 PTS sugar transporter subunit IIB [Anaerolineales bacterium]MCW5839132.1 PTS sugar transporter subunit IIB [Anaerolineales bacterium]MCW5887952.1 PTS sugar transporter subunit IIB [Anaerolineales bacterium]
MKKVWVVCATGIATSTMMRLKVESFLEEEHIAAIVNQYRVTEISPDRVDADVIVATTEIPQEFHSLVPVINGISLITGVGQEETLSELAVVLKKQE